MRKYICCTTVNLSYSLLKRLYCARIGVSVRISKPIAILHQLAHSVPSELTAVLMCISRGRHRHISRPDENGAGERNFFGVALA